MAVLIGVVTFFVFIIFLLSSYWSVGDSVGKYKGDGYGDGDDNDDTYDDILVDEVQKDELGVVVCVYLLFSFLSYTLYLSSRLVPPSFTPLSLSLPPFS